MCCYQQPQTRQSECTRSCQACSCALTNAGAGRRQPSQRPSHRSRPSQLQDRLQHLELALPRHQSPLPSHYCGVTRGWCLTSLPARKLAGPPHQVHQQPQRHLFSHLGVSCRATTLSACSLARRRPVRHLKVARPAPCAPTASPQHPTCLLRCLLDGKARRRPIAVGKHRLLLRSLGQRHLHHRRRRRRAHHRHRHRHEQLASPCCRPHQPPQSQHRKTHCLPAHARATRRSLKCSSRLRALTCELAVRHPT